MSDQPNERLAPVAYLPWVAPSSEQTDDAATPVRGSSRHPAGRAFGEGRPARLVALGRERDGDDESAETGIERDERIDRLIVSRLRRSSLSIAEVRAALVEHGLDDNEVEEWIERYERLGYLDDRRLAEHLVHSHGVRRGRGSGALLHELGRRGIDAELARDALDALDPEVELEHATEVAARRARQLAGLDRVTAERRLSAFLLRRGYGSELVRRAVTSALASDPID
ncbi:regulatory protein RecX [Agromyces sp. NPDC056523]|uniref:regulatory protein RecX n=1 Tax=Agromyces sp. NPDC056523 TaxID=3345850 RepID=UPI00366DD104